jgi:ATP-binding protein involved in chromosome partitioning
MAAHEAIDEFTDPYLGRAWKTLGALRDVRHLDGRWYVDVVLGYPAAGLEQELAARLAALVGAPVRLQLAFAVPPAPQTRAAPVRGVSHIVAVASGKGGVGKSTTAVNLALALAREGAKTGILDADIYGPSIGAMLGVASGRRPEVKDEKYFVPIKAHGIEAMSMSFLVTDSTPMVWRGPMASGALQQLLGQTLWSNLDYLIVDMPPGTGDIQLTLSQRAPVAGAVIVTTPQDIALQDATKGIEMFRKVDIPVLGIVENMSMHTCPKCGHTSHIFGEGGGERIARSYGTELLGSLPLASAIREQMDAGKPTVAVDGEGATSLIYREAARRLAARLWSNLSATASPPTISIDDD